MQMAGGSAEQDDLKAELEASKTENAKDSSNTTSATKDFAVEKQPEKAPTHALSFLSPPKPKMRMELAAALQRPLLQPAKDLPIAAPKVGLTAAPAVSVVVPPAITTANQAPTPKLQQLQVPQQNVQQQDISRGLLKVSARGSKPMPAPWQQGNGDDAAGTAAPVVDVSGSTSTEFIVHTSNGNADNVNLLKLEVRKTCA